MKRQKYLYGKWDTQSIHDLCVAWMKTQDVNDYKTEIARLIAKDSRQISDGQKLDEARLVFLGGDESVTLLYKNDTHLVVLSKGYGAQVLCVIDRKRQREAVGYESY